MKKIGGFFELELKFENLIFHNGAIKLSTGRACVNYISILINWNQRLF